MKSINWFSLVCNFAFVVLSWLSPVIFVVSVFLTAAIALGLVISAVFPRPISAYPAQTVAAILTIGGFLGAGIAMHSLLMISGAVFLALGWAMSLAVSTPTSTIA